MIRRGVKIEVLIRGVKIGVLLAGSERPGGALTGFGSPRRGYWGMGLFGGIGEGFGGTSFLSRCV